jgi:hypothetical protein
MEGPEKRIRGGELVGLQGRKGRGTLSRLCSAQFRTSRQALRQEHPCGVQAPPVSPTPNSIAQGKEGHRVSKVGLTCNAAKTCQNLANCAPVLGPWAHQLQNQLVENERSPRR